MARWSRRVPRGIGDSQDDGRAAATASASVARSPVRLWLPGTVTTSRSGPGGRHPEAVAAALDDEDGHVDLLELGEARLLGRPGGWSGNARQRTPLAFVAAAVRHATRAPAERPPVTSGRPSIGQPLDGRGPGRVELRRARGRLRPATW